MRSALQFLKTSALLSNATLLTLHRVGSFAASHLYSWSRNSGGEVGIEVAVVRNCLLAFHAVVSGRFGDALRRPGPSPGGLE